MDNPKIITIVQARSGSSRLPNKVMMPILEQPLLLRMLERVTAAKKFGTLVVATSTNEEDDVIEELCKNSNINCFRGHPTDLLDRHYKAALSYNPDAVVKIPSDCPLIDTQVIDKVLHYYIDNIDLFDFVSNLHPATYPDGNDVEVMSFASIKEAWQNADKNYEREHTTPYIWERPERFRIGNVTWHDDIDFSSSHRFTIDYLEDYHFIKAVYEELYNDNNLFGIDDILKLLYDKPEIYHINSKFAGKYWYENHLDELTHIDEYKNKLNKT